MICRASRWTQTPSTAPLQPKRNASFLDYTQLLMIGQVEWWTQTPSTIPLQPKNECSFLYYFELLMISQAGQWTQTPSASPLQPIKWNAYFWIMFNFWWSAGLVDGLKPSPPPFSSLKSEMLIFWLCSTSDDRLCWSWTQSPSTTALQPKNEMLILDCVHFWWSTGLIDELEPHLHSSPAKKEMLIFWFVQLLMISLAVQWTQSPSATPLQPINEMLLFGLCSLLMISQAGWWTQTHLPPLSSQKNEMLIFVLHSTSDVGQTGWWTQTPSTTLSSQKSEMLILYYIQQLMLARLVNGLEPHPTPSPANKWNAHILIMFNFWWLAWLVNGLKHHPHRSPAKKNECSFLDYVQLLMICLADWWTSSPSATPLLPKKWNAHFSNTFNFWSAQAGRWTRTHLPPLSYQKNEMLIFGLCSTSDDQPGWSMDSNPICHPSPANKMKCSFLN